MRLTLNIMAVCTLFAAPGMASFIANGSFEIASDNGRVQAPGSTVMNGWTVVGPDDIDRLPTGFAGIPAQDGSWYLDLTGDGFGPTQGGVTQTVALAAGSYTLTFYIGSLGDDEPDSILASAGDQTNVVFTNSALGAGAHWVLATLNFNVAASGPVTITLLGDSAATLAASPFVGLDNVDVELATSATPEPATALLVLLALGGCWLLHTRRLYASKGAN
jgi:hypothetical protein